MSFSVMLARVRFGNLLLLATLLLISCPLVRMAHGGDDDSNVFAPQLVVKDVFSSANQGNDPEKNSPDKGDPTCTSLPAGGEVQGDDSTSNRPPPCRFYDDDRTTGTTHSSGSNSIYFDIYMALRANQQSLGSILSIAVTTFLNFTSPDYMFNFGDHEVIRSVTHFVDQVQEHLHFDDQQLSRTIAFYLDQFRQQTGFDFWELTVSFTNATINVQPKDSAMPPIAQVFLIHYEPEIFLKDETNMYWWWKYRFQYDCFWGLERGGGPILNVEMLDQIYQDVMKLLQSAIELQELHHHILDAVRDNYFFFEIQLDEPQPRQPKEEEDSHRPNPVPQVEFTSSPSPVPSIEIIRKFDAREWDVRRYVGLGILLGTLLSTVSLVLLAHIYSRRRHHHATWGNLATEQGVDQLLRMGWKVRGSRMEIYDKKNSSNVEYYHDDPTFMMSASYDSNRMLGAEISLNPA